MCNRAELPSEPAFDHDTAIRAAFVVGKVLVPQLGPEAGRPRPIPPHLELTTDILLEVLVDAVIGLVPQAEVGDGDGGGEHGSGAGGGEGGESHAGREGGSE